MPTRKFSADAAAPSPILARDNHGSPDGGNIPGPQTLSTSQSYIENILQGILSGPCIANRQHWNTTTPGKFCFLACLAVLIIFQDRYVALLRMIRQWRHIRLLERSGRGHDPTGVAGTKEGECAVLCPACPYPGINLPDDWEKAGRDKAYVSHHFIHPIF